MKILFLDANPPTTSRLDIDAEVREIKNAIQMSSFRDQVISRREDAVDAALLVQCLREFSLREFSPDIVHFSGHGENGHVALRRGDDYKLIKPEMRLEVLRTKKLKLLFLNCYSAENDMFMAGAAQSVIGTTASPAKFGVKASGCSHGLSILNRR